jgi:DNA polymerase I-like protein with 3'-5' exonuclease and polymerase domains
VKHKTTEAAYRLLHDGAEALAWVEHQGVRVDKGYLDAAIAGADAAIAEKERAMRADPVYREWRKAFGPKTKLGSRPQLAEVVFNRLGYQSAGETATGRHRSDKEALETVDLQLVRDFIAVEGMKRDRGYYLEGIRRDMVERDGLWFIHPNFMLNTARSFRSSSGGDRAGGEKAASRELNWQNMPGRDSARAKLVRSAFIPRPGNHFTEDDLAQIEVRVPAAITGDLQLARYVRDKSSDMHRDSAVDLWMLPPADKGYWADKALGKAVRQGTKTNFVFATFYGSAWYTAAKKLWDDIDRYALKGPGGVSLKRWLRKKGIAGLGECAKDATPAPGTFARHVKGCQEKLWAKFSGYKAWKDATYDAYRRDGSLLMVTGFAVSGLHGKNEVTNYPIQGPAFHVELATIIEVVRRIRKYRMKARVVGEIHDSNQGDVPPRELQAYLSIQDEVVTRWLPARWPWMRGVPFEVEHEVSPLGWSWYDKAQWVRAAEGVWAPKA